MLTSIYTYIAHTYIHICLLIFSILSVQFPCFCLPLSICLGSKQVLQQAKHCAIPRRLSVTFSVLGSISPVIIGCLFDCGSTTIAAVSLRQGLLLLMPIENRQGPQMAAVFLMRCIDQAYDSEQCRVVFEGCWEVFGHNQITFYFQMYVSVNSNGTCHGGSNWDKILLLSSS